MKRKLRIILVKVFWAVWFRLGVVWLYRKLRPRRRPTILCMHQIDRMSFQQLVCYLHRHYHIISLDELIRAQQTHQPLPPNTVVLTVDDGYRSCITEILPVLQTQPTPITIYLTAGLIDTEQSFWWDQLQYMLHHTQQPNLSWRARSLPLKSKTQRQKAFAFILNDLKSRPESQKQQALHQLSQTLQVDIALAAGTNPLLTWQEVRTLEQAGVQFGAHTMTHPILSQLPIARAQAEIADSKAAIEAALHTDVQHFCYPNGRAVDFNTEIQAAVRDAGMISAATTIPGYVTSETDLTALPRKSIPDDISLGHFAAIMAGLTDWCPVDYS